MSFDTNKDGAYVAVHQSDQITGYINVSGQVVISQANATTDVPEVVVVWPCDIPRLVKMLRLLAKEADHEY